MTAATVAEALALIPGSKGRLDAQDAILTKAIHHVEHVLNELRPGVVTTFSYQVSTANEEPAPGPAVNWHSRRLEFTPASKRWVIVWVGEDADVPLLSAMRNVRAEVFSALSDGLSPIEHLIIEVADNLQVETTSRSPMLEVARRLSTTLTEAGYPPPK